MSPVCAPGSMPRALSFWASKFIQMPFSRTETVIEDADRLIKECSLVGDPTEAYLAQYTLICLCADMQQAVCSKVREHSVAISSEGFRHYVDSSLGKSLQSVMKGDIAGFLGKFGADVKTNFNNILEENDREIGLYNDVVEARHKVAHVRGITKSFSEIKAALEAAKMILSAADTALQRKFSESLEK